VTIRVVIADDNILIRAGLQRLLLHDPEIEVVAECSTYDELIAAVELHLPDVVLTDIRMPPTNSNEGVRAAEHIRANHSGCGVVLLSQYIEPAYVSVLLAQGTKGRGYLLKERVSDFDELVRALRSIAGGGTVLDPKAVEALVQTRGSVGGSLSRLTPRETEVLKSIAEGRTNAAIADALYLSRKAVEKHINSIFSKLGLTGNEDTHPRVQAVLLYLAERTPE